MKINKNKDKLKINNIFEIIIYYNIIMELSNENKESKNIKRMNLELRDSFIKTDIKRKTLKNVNYFIIVYILIFY